MAAILSIYDLHRYSFREWSLTPAHGGRGYYAVMGQGSFGGGGVLVGGAGPCDHAYCGGDNQGQGYGGGGGGEVDTGMQGIILLELETSG